MFGKPSLDQPDASAEVHTPHHVTWRYGGRDNLRSEEAVRVFVPKEVLKSLKCSPTMVLINYVVNLMRSIVLTSVCREHTSAILDAFYPSRRQAPGINALPK